MTDYTRRGIHTHSASGLTKVGPNSMEANSITGLALNATVDVLEALIAELRARIVVLEAQVTAKA